MSTSTTRKKKIPDEPFNLFDLRNFDIYTKVEEDFVLQTNVGASLSLVGWFIIIILVLAEINSYMTVQHKEHMIVDTTLGQHLRINIDITFHALTCAEVNVDAMDVAGDNQVVQHQSFLCSLYFSYCFVFVLLPRVLLMICTSNE